MLWRILMLTYAILFVIWCIYIEHITIPSCRVVSPPTTTTTFTTVERDFTVVFVANFNLEGPKDASFYTLFVTDFFLAKFLQKSFKLLKPDKLVVLGDVSANGFNLTMKEWSSVVQRFEEILGPYRNISLHMTLGDRDIGKCSKLNPVLVNQVASFFPGLDPTGCDSFEINKVGFVSLNSVPLLCGNNQLIDDVETAIETESANLRRRREGREKVMQSKDTDENSDNSCLGEDSASDQSGPVVLVHFPLNKAPKRSCRMTSSLSLLQTRVYGNSGPYKLLHAVPPNASEYIFRALKPRMIFSAHRHEFCDVTHPDGTREVYVPAISWTAENDPGFVAATFKRNGAVKVMYCSVPSESYVAAVCLITYILSLSAASLMCMLPLKMDRPLRQPRGRR